MRNIEERSLSLLEDIVKDSTQQIGVQMEDGSIALLLRLIMSGIGRHFFYEPDTLIRVGFMEFRKSPNKDELFTVNILRSGKDGVVNADTLWKYYKGDLAREEQLKGLLDTFVNELLQYSQSQEISIAMMTSNINSKKEKKNGVQKK